MRFVDLLKATVLLSAISATVLVAVTLVAASADDDAALARLATVWWAIALIIGVLLSRRPHISRAIGRLLAEAREAQMMPEVAPARTLINRLWPLLLSMVAAAAAAAAVGPQVPAIVAGVAIIWALAWRRQAQAVVAIQERDGVTFFVLRTSPLRAIKLQRMPGFRRERAIGGGA